ncbi:MAG: surface-adhesin E family protein [Herbaspirillum sp.]
MKFAALTLLLMSNQVFAAQWTLLGDNGLGTFFVDKSSIRRSHSILRAGITQANILLNWNQPQLLQGGLGTHYASEVSIAYLDCKKKRIGFGSRTMYPRPNAQGEALLSPSLDYSNVKLQDVEADSTGAQMLKVICETK